ncbi:MAG: 50S ribosomal protein L2 [Candidatus Gracilibacteria bacterium]
MLKKYKPTTPSRRGMSSPSFVEITKSTPEKGLTKRIKKNSGRNNQGRITIRHRGGGHKRVMRDVDMKQVDKLDIEGQVKAIEYDPLRSAYIMLVTYKDGEKRYHLAPEGIKVGDKIVTKVKAKAKLGSRMTLKHIPVGYQVHNVELIPRQGGKIARSAGTFVTVVSLEGNMAQIQPSSGEVRLVPKDCFASIGIIGNLEHSSIRVGKAGTTRWKGRRPTVLGKSMNPCDHPHGGGEGHSPIGLKHPKTPWGMPALGFKTRKRKTTDKYIIKDRRHG